MSVQEDVIRLKMETIGASGLDAMEAKVRLMQGSLDQLAQQFKAGAISEKEFEDHAEGIAAALQRLKAHVKVGHEIAAAMQAAAAANAIAAHEAYEFSDVYDVMATSVNRVTAAEQEAIDRTRAMGAALSDAGHQASSAAGQIEKVNGVIPRITRQGKDAKASMSGLSYAMQQTAYFADDLQYGFRGISNQLAPMLGMFGTWGSVVAIGAIGAYHVAENWRSLTAAFRGDLIEQKSAQIKALTDRMEELEKQTTLTAKEMQELGNLQVEIEGRKAAEKDATTPTADQQAIKGAYQEALTGKGGGYGQIEGAAQAALQSDFMKHAIERLLDAEAEGTLKDDKGNAIAINKGRLADDDYVKRLMAHYVSSAMQTRKNDLLNRIGTKGDPQALGELQKMLEEAGWAFDDDGNVTAQNGRHMVAMSKLMANSPAVARRRQQQESDAADVAGMKGEQEEAFKQKVAELAKEMQDRVGAAIANGKDADQVVAMISQMLKQNPLTKDFGGTKGNSVWAKAIGEQVQRDINKQVFDLMKSNNGMREEDAKAIVNKRLNENANKFTNEKAARNREADNRVAEEQEKAKKERDSALDSGIDEDLQGQIMAGLLANRQMALPGNRSTAAQKRRQAADLARFEDRIIQEVRRDLIQGGMDPGKAEQLAAQAPEYFQEQYNAWRLRQVAPGGGGIADPQNPTVQERARGVRPNLGPDAWQGRRGGFRSVGVDGPGGGEAVGEEAVDLNRQAFQTSTKAVQVVDKLARQVGPLMAGWPRMIQRLNQIDRQVESFQQYSRTASMVERGG